MSWGAWCSHRRLARGRWAFLRRRRGKKVLFYSKLYCSIDRQTQDPRNSPPVGGSGGPGSDPEAWGASEQRVKHPSSWAEGGHRRRELPSGGERGAGEGAFCPRVLLLGPPGICLDLTWTFLARSILSLRIFLRKNGPEPGCTFSDVLR